MEKGAFYREGMVGVSLTGDIRMRSFVSQGARRVGPTFNADKVLDAPLTAVARGAARPIVPLVLPELSFRMMLTFCGVVLFTTHRIDRHRSCYIHDLLVLWVLLRNF